MKRIILFALFAVISISGVFAQYTTPQNYKWCFGRFAGLDFSSGSPTAFICSLSAGEGSTSVADAAGNLLFYTEGKRVWDRTNAVMPAGGSIATFGTASATMSSLIIPVSGSSTQYYLFSMEEVPGTSGYCHMQYCIVDMSLRGGLGDVIAATIGTAVRNKLCEKLVSVPGNNCNIWLLTHSKDSAIFLAYNITASGISAPVISTSGTRTTVGTYGGYAVGEMKVSPDRRRVVTANYNAGGSVGGEIYDFDPATGIVSNCILLDSTNALYGAEFSPNNSVVYFQYPGGIYQYDLSSGTAATIRASRFRAGAASSYTTMRLGPDGKIYFNAGSAMGCIATPNVVGSGCGYTASAVSLSSGSSGSLGMPNMFVSVGGGDTTYSRTDTIVCIPTGGSINLTARTLSASRVNYLWNDGITTRTHATTATGTYWVLVDTGGCHMWLDTFVVTSPPPVNTTNVHDTSVCVFTYPAILRATPGFATYNWSSSASTASTLSVGTAGTYYVWAADSCNNVTTDTFHVYDIPPDTVAGSATSYAPCILTAPLSLTATGSFTAVRWSSGPTTTTIAVSTSGTYIAFKRTNCSIIADTFHVNFITVPVLNLGPDRQICIGDSVVLQSTQPAGTTYTWSNGNTGDSIHVLTSGTYWLRLYNGCSITDTVRILVSPYPVVDLGPDTFNCEGTPITLQSSITYTSPSYIWSDGTTASSDVVNFTGIYWLRVTVLGCASTDSVNVTILYDTLRLYNGDTAICKGKPVQALLNTNPAATVQWLPTSGIAVSNVANALIIPDTSAMYVCYVYLTGCPVKTDSFFIDVQPVPEVYIGGNRFICQYDTIHIDAIVKPNWYRSYSYSWSPATSLDFTTTSTVVFTAGATNKYYVTVTTPAGCKGMDSAQLIVNPGDFGGISPDANICPHDSVQLTATGAAGYVWHPGLYLSDSTSDKPWVKAIAPITYRVVMTSAAGCHDTMSVHVNVFPGALLSLDDSVTLYPGESIQLNPLTNCNTFQWFPPAGLSSTTISNPIANPDVDTKYIVTGWTTDGCKATDSILVRINTESVIIMPNAFTPGNGVNRTFNVILKGQATLNHFRVYNRWGQVVFEATNIKDGWDGTFNGAPQPFGVYVYDVEAVTSNGSFISKHGNVTLLR